ncbi:MAG: DUF721 domain-containing protein [Syntrophobacteraceae bacterium]|jgi:hypothetical protein|nr:DUF721 domain-containing protein [Syntrophobacteraceae bacterium]
MKHGAKDIPLGSVVQTVMKAHPAFQANPLGNWAEIVGPDAAQASQPVSLRKGTLVIVTDAPVWHHHLEMHKIALMDAINVRHTEPLVHKIVIRIGSLPESPPALNPEHRKLHRIQTGRSKPPKPKKAKARALTPEEKAFLKSIPDPDLRAIGTRLLKHTPPDES